MAVSLSSVKKYPFSSDFQRVGVPRPSCPSRAQLVCGPLVLLKSRPDTVHRHLPHPMQSPPMNSLRQEERPSLVISFAYHWPRWMPHSAHPSLFWRALAPACVHLPTFLSELRLLQPFPLHSGLYCCSTTSLRAIMRSLEYWSYSLLSANSQALPF